ncbi:MAG: hypothetical protein JWM33_1911 [Caulobacteraceae bacterium]|nr:hypothetical protein [Caulobacteraceae bacterium]
MPQYDRPMSVTAMKAVRDEDIDFSDIPEADAEFWAQAKVQMPGGQKTPLNLRLDTDMLDWFRSQGRGYQTRMNAVLRSFYEAHKKQSGV